jgi:hypothetical protein
MADEDHFFRYRANSMTRRIVPTYYRILADIESDERLSGVYRRLAESKEEHLRSLATLTNVGYEAS